MKKFEITVCMIILLMISGCGRHVETGSYEIDKFGNINAVISEGMVLEIENFNELQGKHTPDSYSECSIVEFKADELSRLFEIPEADINIDNGTVYYNNGEFTPEIYEESEAAEGTEHIIYDSFIKYGECLKSLGISIWENYTWKVLSLEHGYEIYYMKIYQEQNSIKIYDGIHGEFEKASIVCGPYIELYFDKNNIYRLIINDIVKIGKENKDESIIEVTRVIEKVIYTYGRIISSDIYRIKKADIWYMVFKETDGSISLKPIWVVDCDICSKDGSVYNIKILYDGYTGKEVI